MSYYVFTNPEKEGVAREIVQKKGLVLGGRPDPRTGEIALAQSVLYQRAKTQNPNMDDEELVLYIYKGLGGRVEEFHTKEEAEMRGTALKEIRVKQTRQDVA